MKNEILIQNPTFVVRHNKHHAREFYLLPTKEHYIKIPGVSSDKTLKRIGPAIVEVTEFGIQRKIVSHKLNSPTIWSEFSDYINAGLWALNHKTSVKQMPKELAQKSKRFS